MNSVQKRINNDKNIIPNDKIEGAFLGAAIGDALGWPFERPYMRFDYNSKSNIDEVHISFQNWVRKSGSRYNKYKETIVEGEYSDDTQLILAVARSLQHSENWTKYFCYQELPLWLLYERGGGGALKWSADKWMRGIPPWQYKATKMKDKGRYFNAGGNGVAMRILPHVFIPRQNIESLYKQVMLNGICTHGHPRALIGALLYAKAAWLIFKTEKTLSYGELINSILKTKNEISKMPNVEFFHKDWWIAIDEYYKGRYQNLWDEIIEEVMINLEICNNAMEKGALAIDHEILEKIGCFNKSINGAGTVAAVASIYLASRYAADPITGLFEIIHEKGADTDTLASMLGGLFGTLLGTDWLIPEWEQLQDRKYISLLANTIGNLSNKKFENKEFNNEVWSRKNNDNIKNVLIKGQKEDIPLGSIGMAKVESSIEHINSTKSSITKSWKLKTNDGQTLYITKISKTRKKDEPKVEDTFKPKVSKTKINSSVRMRKMLDNLSELFPEHIPANTALIYMEEIIKVLEEEKKNYSNENFLNKSQNEKYIRDLIEKYPKLKLDKIEEENMIYIIKLISKFMYDISS